MSNREILFRGKNKKGEWIEGYLSWENEISYKNTDVCAGPAYFDGTDFYTVKSCVINPKTLGQFTGLTDVNGTKIFEGDIVAFEDVISTENGYYERICCGKVVWDSEMARFEVTNSLSAESYEVLWECKVIGNIHDNPELLEESEQE